MAMPSSTPSTQEAKHELDSLRTALDSMAGPCLLFKVQQSNECM